jgi:sugar phosphate isomerase/epimerase
MKLFNRTLQTVVAATLASTALFGAIVPAQAQSELTQIGIPLDRIGVVAFTAREQITADAEGTIKALAECGIKNFEFSFSKLDADVPSFLGVEVPTLKQYAEEFDFNIPSLGISAADLRDRLDVVVSTSKELGARFVRISGGFELEGQAPADYYTSLAALLNEAGAALKAEGITLAYHNHDAEFEDVGDGRSGYDILLAEVDPEKAAFELDLYWAVNGAADPVELITNNPDRFVLYHVKDAQRVTNNGVEEITFATVGQGFIDFEQIFALEPTSNVEYFFIENDRPQPDGITSACEGYAYLVGDAQ